MGSWVSHLLVPSFSNDVVGLTLVLFCYTKDSRILDFQWYFKNIDDRINWLKQSTENDLLFLVHIQNSKFLYISLSGALDLEHIHTHTHHTSKNCFYYIGLCKVTFTCV